jgi:hypothetical protein
MDSATFCMRVAIWRAFSNSAPPRTVVTAIGIRIANSRHSSLSVAFLFTIDTAVGNGAMNKFRNCSQWRSDLFRIIFFHLKGSQRMVDGWIFLQTSSPHSLITTYRTKLVFARPISLDGTFNVQNFSLFRCF